MKIADPATKPTPALATPQRPLKIIGSIPLENPNNNKKIRIFILIKTVLSKKLTVEGPTALLKTFAQYIDNNKMN